MKKIESVFVTFYQEIISNTCDAVENVHAHDSGLHLSIFRVLFELVHAP